MEPAIWHTRGTELAHEIDATTVPGGQLRLWYLGQCGFIIKSSDCTIGIDLVLSQLYDAHQNPRRLYPPPFPGGSAPRLTHLFCSHSHADHLDLPTLAGILESQAACRCIIPSGIQEKGASLPQEQMMYAIQNEAIKLSDECSVLPIMVAHESYETDSRGFSRFLGYLFSFPGISLFHSGDAVFESNLVRTLSPRLPIDVMMLPINGTDAVRKHLGIIGNMQPEQALQLASLSHARLVIPMHFDMFANNGADPEAFVRSAQASALPFQIWVPKLGTSIWIPEQGKRDSHL
ncbi:MAG: MBL fold metallo-hydrolase [Sphaerochaeta sp.]|uniref:MBL fold metallo-hydrolase n=1 Tax=Sphaerochaeta sp. TaxID=1972642 RepID=UPI003D10FE44